MPYGFIAVYRRQRTGVWDVFQGSNKSVCRAFALSLVQFAA